MSEITFVLETETVQSCNIQAQSFSKTRISSYEAYLKANCIASASWKKYFERVLTFLFHLGTKVFQSYHPTPKQEQILTPKFENQQKHFKIASSNFVTVKNSLGKHQSAWRHHTIWRSLFFEI